MPHPPRALASLTLALAVCLAATAGHASDDGSTKSVGGVVYDALIERPLGLAETAVGLAITPIAYPLSLGTGRSHQVIERCVSTPARYTFTRTLGDFEERPSSNCGPVGLGWSVTQMGLGILGRPLEMVFGGSPLGREQPSQRKDEIEI